MCRLPWNRLSCELKQLCDNENSVCNRTRKHNTNQLDSQTTFVVSVVENENFTSALRDYLNFLNLYTFNRRRVEDTFFPQVYKFKFFLEQAVYFNI